MALNFRTILTGLRIFPKTASSADSLGEIEVITGSTKASFHNGTTTSPVVTETHASQGANRLTNKDLEDSSTKIVDASDTTKKIAFDAAGTTGTSTTITSSQTTNKTLTLPDATDTLVGKATTDTLTNKTISGSSNTITNISLTAGVTGILPIGNGGTNSNTSLVSGKMIVSTSGSIVEANADSSMNSNKITNVKDPTSAQDAATKAYVDAGLAALNPATSVYAASTTNIVGTYSNGVAGIGAFFTVTATGAFTIDGTTPPQGSRILIKDQSSGFQNGIYDLTVSGSLGISPILTRSLDYNTASDMNSSGLIPVINGTTNSLSSWQQIAVITTVGSDSLVFSEFTANPSLYLLKSNNLSDVSNTTTSFNNISGLTTSGDTIYGGASGTRTRLAGNTTSTKKFLTQTGDGVNSAAPGWNTIVSGDVPTLNQNTTGTSLNVTGVVTETHGGTNQSTYTTGDILYSSSSNTLSKLAIGTADQMLAIASGVPSWAGPTYIVSSAVSSQTITSGSATDVTNLSVSITTTGRPVILMLVSDGSASVIQLSQSATNVSGTIRFVRGSTTISNQEVQVTNTGSSATSTQTEVAASAFMHFDPVAAGTYTYKVQATISGGSSQSIFFDHIKLVAYQI